MRVTVKCLIIILLSLSLMDWILKPKFYALQKCAKIIFSLRRNNKAVVHWEDKQVTAEKSFSTVNDFHEGP